MCYRYYIDKFFSYKLDDVARGEGIVPSDMMRGIIHVIEDDYPRYAYEKTK